MRTEQQRNAQQNTEDWRDWLEHLKNVRKLSPATIRSYRRDLEAWADYLDTQFLGPDEARQKDARRFMAEMSARHMAAATVNRRLSALKGYYEWRRRQTGAGENPFDATRTVKKGRHLPGYLTHDELEQFLSRCEDDFAGRRDRLLLELLYSTGCRVAEICALNLPDVQKTGIRIKGKGGKERVVFAGKQARSALNAYLPLRAQSAAADEDSARALILDVQGKRLTTRGVYYIIRKYAALTGISKKISPHTFRHTFATHILNEGADIRVVQEMLGHSSLSTTQIYTHTGIEKMKQVYRLSHPHARRTMEPGLEEGGTHV